MVFAALSEICTRLSCWRWVRSTKAGFSALRQPYLGRRSAKGIIAVLLVAKLLATAYTASNADSYMYDAGHHLQRAESAGFEVTRRFYNPPLYYLPIAPFIENQRLFPSSPAARKSAIINFYRVTNVIYWSAFYCAWLYVIFPAVLPSWQSGFLASVLLLAFPGFQRLAKMVHPDNVFCALSAVAFAAWIVAERRYRPGSSSACARPVSWGWVFGLALVIGATGATRPFAVVPVILLSAASVWLLIRKQTRPLRQLLTKGIMAASIIATLSGGWWAYRLVVLPTALTDVYFKSREKYVAQRQGFDWSHYFGSFYFDELQQTPNRTYRRLDRRSRRRPNDDSFFTNRHANSFFTILYSETWGDHWLYFSGEAGKERRQHTKRFVLSAALVPTLLLLLRTLWIVGRLAHDFVKRRWPAPPQTLLLALLAVGISLYLYWQTGDALKPGKQSTVKFIYIAYLYPAAAAIPFLYRTKGALFNLFGVVLALLFLVAYPMSLALPGE